MGWDEVLNKPLKQIETKKCLDHKVEGPERDSEKEIPYIWSVQIKINPIKDINAVKKKNRRIKNSPVF